MTKVTGNLFFVSQATENLAKLTPTLRTRIGETSDCQI